MISQELLNILRCPIDPIRTARLTLDSERLICERCGVRYPIKDGLPVMIVDEAELPAGCPRLEQLPCQQEPKKT
jgi:uncharacterized protein YbaR (Trm112 family)